MVPRVTDIYAALPSITGKFELEYEGELRGAEQIARDLIRAAVGTVFTGVSTASTRARSSSGSISADAAAQRQHAADEVISADARRAGAARAGRARRPAPGAPAPAVASAIDFVLEGLYAQKKIGRSDERGYSAAEAAPRRGDARREETSDGRRDPDPEGKKKYYN